MSSAVTGSARKIKDNAADWHNLFLRWEKVNDEGVTLATKVVNLQRERSQTDERQQVDGGGAPASSQSAGGSAAALQEECDKLHDVVDKLDAIVRKMQRLVLTQAGILDLEAFQFGPGGRKDPLFHTWSTRMFEETCRSLLDWFSQELALKKTILQDLAHTESPDLCLVYVSCWLHQPFIPPRARLSLEAMLLETGHRTL